MSDATIHHRIHELIEQEHALRQRGDAPTEEDRAALARVEESLDQCWDLLRQRDARRHAGQDPDVARARPNGTVEGYMQ